MPIVRGPLPEREFTVIPNRLLNDTPLSWAARGMLAHLLSKPAHWAVNVQALINETRDAQRPVGRDAVYKILEELTAARYINRRRKADGSMVWTVFDEPYPENPDEGDEPHTENPHEEAAQGKAGDDEPHPEKPDRDNPDLGFPDVLVRTEKAVRTKTPAKRDEDFAAFWAAYPKKVAKPAALKAFTRIKPSSDVLARMIEKVELAKQSDGWRKDGGQFIPHPATWLNGRRWEDGEGEGVAEDQFVGAI